MTKRFNSRLVIALVYIVCGFALLNCSNLSEKEMERKIVSDTSVSWRYYRDFDLFKLKGVLELDSSHIEYPFVMIHSHNGKITEFRAFWTAKHEITRKIQYSKEGIPFSTWEDSGGGTKHETYYKDGFLYDIDFYTPGEDAFLESINITYPSEKIRYIFKPFIISFEKFQSYVSIDSLLVVEGSKINRVEKEEYHLEKGRIYYKKSEIKKENKVLIEEKVYASNNASIFWWMCYGQYFEKY